MLREKTENWPNPSKGGGEGGWGHPFGKTPNYFPLIFLKASLSVYCKLCKKSYYIMCNILPFIAFEDTARP